MTPYLVPATFLSLIVLSSACRTDGDDSTVRDELASPSGGTADSRQLVPVKNNFTTQLRAVSCVESADRVIAMQIPGRPRPSPSPWQWNAFVKDGTDGQACADQIVKAIPGTTINDVSTEAATNKVRIRLTPPAKNDVLVPVATDFPTQLKTLSCVKSVDRALSLGLPGHLKPGPVATRWIVGVQDGIDGQACADEIVKAIPGTTITDSSTRTTTKLLVTPPANND